MPPKKRRAKGAKKNAHKQKNKAADDRIADLSKVLSYFVSGEGVRPYR